MLLATTGLFVLTNLTHATIITISPGFGYAKSSGKQTLQLQTSPQELSNQYVANHNWNGTFAPTLFIGKEFNQEWLKFHLGLTLGYVDNAGGEGIINQFALPDFDNLNYQYDIQSLSAMATLKLFFLASQRWQPYIDGGVGFSNNYAANYQESPRILGAEPMSPYRNHSVNSFAYSVGAGLMYNLNSAVAAGLGYQFADLGKTRLGVSDAQQTRQTPSINHLFLHQLLINITWNT